MQNELNESVTREDYLNLNAQLTASLVKLRIDILQVKLRKYCRDTEDYSHRRVYNWQEERRHRRGRPDTQGRRGTHTSDVTSQSTDSEHETDQWAPSRNQSRWNQAQVERGDRFFGAHPEDVPGNPHQRQPQLQSRHVEADTGQPPFKVSLPKRNTRTQRK